MRQHVLFVVVSTMTATLFAQELGYGGTGSINHGFAGATVAVPLDGSGAMYWNPATLGALEHGELQLGFGRVNPPWYGDESLAYAVVVPVVAVYVLVVATDSDNWREIGESSNKSRDEKDKEESETDSQNPSAFRTVRGLNFSYVMPPDRSRRWNVGFGIAETGSRKHRILTDETGQPEAAQLYRVKTTEFTPTATWRFSRRFYVGLTPILSVTEFPTASLPTLPGYEQKAEREHCGFGLQLGTYYETKRGFNFGFSIRSPHWIPSQRVQWIDSQGDVLERDLRYSTEYPMRYVLGIAYTGFERFKLAIDVRHYDFQHLASFYDVSGGRSPRRATSYAVGVQYEPDREETPLTFRLGYQFNDSPASWDAYYFNLTSPIARGHSIHYGISFGIPDKKGFEISFSLSHAFGGGRTYYLTSSGRESFRNNPNESVFWWSFRFKF